MPPLRVRTWPRTAARLILHWFWSRSTVQCFNSLGLGALYTDIRYLLYCVCAYIYIYVAEGPSTQYLRTLIPKTIPLMAFGTRVLKYWVLGPAGCGILIIILGPIPSKLAVLSAPSSPMHFQEKPKRSLGFLQTNVAPKLRTPSQRLECSCFLGSIFSSLRRNRS